MKQNTFPLRTIITLLLLVFLSSFTVAITLAGSDEEEHTDCEVEALVEAQAEYLEHIEHFAEEAAEDLDAALESLWEAGHGLQKLAEDCGFAPPEDMDMDGMAMGDDDHADDADDHADDGDDMAGMDMDGGHEAGEIPDEEVIMAFAMSLGDPANGEELFNTLTETGFACATCHNTDSRDPLVGPGLLSVAYVDHTHSMGGEVEELPFEVHDDAAVSKTALQYIYTSIVNPSAVVQEGFPDLVMPQIFSDVFTEEEIIDIMSYLVTLAPEHDE